MEKSKKCNFGKYCIRLITLGIAVLSLILLLIPYEARYEEWTTYKGSSDVDISYEGVSYYLMLARTSDTFGLIASIIFLSLQGIAVIVTALSIFNKFRVFKKTPFILLHATSLVFFILSIICNNGYHRLSSGANTYWSQYGIKVTHTNNLFVDIWNIFTILVLILLVLTVALKIIDSFYILDKEGKVKDAEEALERKKKKLKANPVYVIPMQTNTESEQSSDSTMNASNMLAEINKYKMLLDSGIITQEEFDAKKKQLLDL